VTNRNSKYPGGHGSEKEVRRILHGGLEAFVAMMEQEPFTIPAQKGG